MSLAPVMRERLVWRGGVGRAARIVLCCGLVLMNAAGAGTCDSGQRQSPIDISMTQRQALPALQFDYRAAPLKIVNDGHTLRVRFGRGSQLRIGKQRYALQQFHFHTPGGEKLAGQEFPMAAHLLHKAADGQLLAVVVLLRLGAENLLLNELLPLIPQRADGDHSPAGRTVDASALLPADRGYYRYSGSLTSPPCTEGVEWVVLKQPLELSAEQLARYRRHFADNARAVQPLHRRVVLESL